LTDALEVALRNAAAPYPCSTAHSRCDSYDECARTTSTCAAFRAYVYGTPDWRALERVPDIPLDAIGRGRNADEVDEEEFEARANDLQARAARTRAERMAAAEDARSARLAELYVALAALPTQPTAAALSSQLGLSYESARTLKSHSAEFERAFNAKLLVVPRWRFHRA